MGLERTVANCIVKSIDIINSHMLALKYTIPNFNILNNFDWKDMS